MKATYFSKRLDFTDKKKPERNEFRTDWYHESLSKLAGKDIVCVDPDNGLIVPSAAGRPKENKYVLRNELTGYYAQGSSVIYYQHKARRKDEFYVRQHDELVHSKDFPDAERLGLKFVTTSQRYYLFIIQPRHATTIETAINEMLSTAWGNHFHML